MVFRSTSVGGVSSPTLKTRHTSSTSSYDGEGDNKVRYSRTKRTPDHVLRYLAKCKQKGQARSTLATIAGRMATTKQDIKAHCIQSLSELGATQEYCTFFGDVLQTEQDMNIAVYRLQQKLRPDVEGEPVNPSDLFLMLQELTQGFNSWKSNIEELCQRGESIPGLEIAAEHVTESRVLKLLCSMDTKDVHLEEGDQVTITETKPNRLKIRTLSGDVGFVPTLCCILPTPDKTAPTAVERLRIQLLCSWTECVRKSKHLLSNCLLTNCKRLGREWKPPNQNGPTIAKDRVTRRIRRILDAATRAPHCDYSKLHSCLYSLEKELVSHSLNGAGGNDLTLTINKVANLDKSVLCFYNFYKQWHLFRRAMEHSSLRPIRVVENILDLKQPSANPRNFKYLEYKMTVENVETVEEIVYSNNTNSEDGVSSTGFGCRTEKVKADQITSTEQEEKKRFFIKGVVDPRDMSTIISIRDAVEQGIVDQDRGLYVNPDTGDGMPIPAAMSADLIRVEYATTTKSVAKTRAIGLIQVRTPEESQPFVVTGALDPLTAEKVDLVEAKRRGLINESETTYTLISTNEEFPIHEAAMSGWVLAEFEGGEQRYQTKKYAVHSVVDQRMKKKVPFMEAVRRNLIDRSTGTYVNNVTGDRIYVVEAIRRGFLKATVVDDISGLDIDAENKMVVENVDKIRKSVMKSVGVIKAFKEAAKRAPKANK